MNEYPLITFKDAKEVIPININSVYTIIQAAQLCQVEKRTIYNWVNNGTLKAIKHGNSYRILGQNLLERFNSK